jgi:hypothetical protein
MKEEDKSLIVRPSGLEIFDPNSQSELITRGIVSIKNNTKKEEISSFFDILARSRGHSGSETLRDFWLQYIDSISMCRPIFHLAPRQCSSEIQALYRQRRQPAVLKGAPPDVHALLIQMGEFLFVEFGPRGGCYCYHKNSSPIKINSSEYRIQDLRSRDLAVDFFGINSESRLANFVDRVKSLEEGK